MKTVLSGLILLVVLIWCGCDEGNPVTPTTAPNPPEDTFGVTAQLAEDVDMLLLWKAPGTGSSPTGYNVFRRIGGDSFEKLNESAVMASPFGPGGVSYPEVLYFADTTYDTTSALAHKYYVVSIAGDEESDPSDTVSCIPANISRANTVESVSPAGEEEGVDRVPVFDWDAEVGAASYFVFLREAEDYYPRWMHRVSDIGCTFKTTSGITYLDATGDSLESIHEYTWLVWAISSDNCGFAFSEASFTTTYGTVVATVVDGAHEAGTYVACWDQTDDDAIQVPEGNYTIHTISNDFESYSESFEIDNDAEHVGSNCDPPVTIPAVPNLYRTGDIIAISYALPVASNVRIDIVQ